MKRFFAIFLVLCLIGGLLPASALADGEGTVSSAVKDEDGTYAKFDITYNVTDQSLITNGFSVGIGFGTQQISQDSHGNWNCQMWDQRSTEWQDNLPSSDTFECVVDELIPNRTYNYFAYIMDQNRNVIVRGAEGTFTTANGSVYPLSFTDPTDPATSLQGKSNFNKVVCSFTPGQSGFYAVVGTDIVSIKVQDANGNHILYTDRNDPGDLNAVFYANASETLYIFVGVQDDKTAAVAVRDGVNYLNALELGQNDIHSDQIVRFQATKAGWYLFELSGDRFNGGMRRMENGNWQHCDNGSYTARLAKDDAVILQGQYDEYHDGARTLTVTEITPPAKDSISSASQPEEGSVFGTQATIPVTLYVSAATAEAGYRWGIEYSVFPSFTKDGHRSTGEWTQESYSPMNGQTLYTRPDQLIPGRTYYYRAVIYDFNGNAIAGEPVANARSFRAATDTVPTALTLNTPVTVQSHDLALFTFDPEADGNAGSDMYAVVTTGMGNINILRDDGENFSGGWNQDNSPDYQFKVPFSAGDGKVYILANNYIDETGDTTLTVVDAQGVVDQLTLGTAMAVHQNTVVSFKATEAGSYRVRSVNPSKDFLHIYNSETGEWDWRGSTTGPIEMKANETRYFIAWYDENSEGTISLIAEKINFNPNPATADELYADLAIANADAGNFNSDSAYTATLSGNVTLTGDVVIPRTMQLHVAATLTVGGGASLTNHGDLYVDKDGILALSSGATFAQSGYDDWTAAFVLNGGSFTNNGGNIDGIASDTAAVVLSCDEYGGMDAGLAAAGGISSDKIILEIAPQSQEELDALLTASKDFGLVELYVNSGKSFTAPDTVPRKVTFVLASGGTLTVPVNTGMNLPGSIVLNGGELVNNGDIYVNGGRIQWNKESVFRNNGALNVFPPDSSYVGIARWNPIDTATITNAGTVRIFCEGLDESRVIISGGTVHRNTEDTATFTLPEDVTTIGEEAFAGIDAEAVFIHHGVTSIGKRAFADCPNLQSVNIQNGNIDISEDFLEGCSKGLIIIVDPTSTAGENRETYISYLK